MQITASKIVLFFTMLVVLINPPMVLGLLGTEGKRMGHIIEEGLGTDTLRVSLFGRR
ncbi:hypothetical protein [Phreatobacter aquaticus]|uniref:hypothetical protein n=1 Tax=Phreatobacter aquaticus TaxID=2570229 RepID=UPI00143D9E54|nr:hypothetical protein [Phreatobacter aquaticus]